MSITRQKVDLILSLFREGRDTKTISIILRLPESLIYNTIARRPA